MLGALIISKKPILSLTPNLTPNPSRTRMKPESDVVVFRCFGQQWFAIYYSCSNEEARTAWVAVGQWNNRPTRARVAKPVPARNVAEGPN